MHEFHGGSDFRLHDDPGIKLTSVGRCLMFVFSLVHYGINWTFSLVFVFERRALFFVSSQHVYRFDCFPMMIH